MRTLVIRFAVVLASLTACRGLAAQEMPTFHDGLWAAEFSGGAASNEGVMRFFNQRSALVLSVSGSLAHTRSTPDGGTASTTTERSVFLALGVRRHTPVASRVLATTEIGADLSFQRGKTADDAFGNPVTARQSENRYGIYGEVGGQYFVASHLALGTVLTVNANMMSGRMESGGSGRDLRGFFLSTSLRPIRITLYF